MNFLSDNSIGASPPVLPASSGRMKVPSRLRRRPADAAIEGRSANCSNMRWRCSRATGTGAKRSRSRRSCRPSGSRSRTARRMSSTTNAARPNSTCTAPRWPGSGSRREDRAADVESFLAGLPPREADAAERALDLAGNRMRARSNAGRGRGAPGIAHRSGIKLHMDGARFANALVALGCTPAEMTWKSGVDVLSFGATKNGCLAAEAILVFDRHAAETLAYRRKRGGHLLRKGG